MARGFTGVRNASADIQARKEAGGTGGKLFFRLKDGESAVVRFLGEPACAWVHELPPTEGRSFGIKVPCRDQNEEMQRIGEECPGCDRQLKRTFQGAINLIWRDAPVFERDEQNRLVRGENNKPNVVGTEDQIAVWVAGITVYEELDGIDVDFEGLTSRDFKVSRKGSGLTTKYTVRPANPNAGAEELSKADAELAESAHDLAFFVEPPALETWGKAPEASSKPATTVPADTSPFMGRRRSS